MGNSIVSLQHVEKWFGSNHVVKDMNLEIEEGEFLTLLGPSGCGKTTTLRMIALLVIGLLTVNAFQRRRRKKDARLAAEAEMAISSAHGG